MLTGQQFKMMRLGFGLSAVDFSILFEVHPVTMSRWERLPDLSAKKTREKNKIVLLAYDWWQKNQAKALGIGARLQVVIKLAGEVKARSLFLDTINGGWLIMEEPKFDPWSAQ